MSKLSRFLLGVIIAGLAFIVSLRFYRTYQYNRQQQEMENADVFTFQNIPVDLPVYRRLAENQTEEIFLEDVPLPVEMQKEQARQTIRSILADYEQEPVLQDFYADLKKETGQDINLADLSGENLPFLLEQYPQIQPIIERYSKNSQFTQHLNEIFSNPQFIRSVEILQVQKEK